MKPSVTRSALVAGSLLAAGLVGLACSGDGTGPGNPGAAGASAGSGAGGTGGGGTAGSGGAGGTSPNFMAVPPCNAESDYMTGTTVSFPMSATNFSYSPKCLKVTAGTTVAFSGDFTGHPLEPSANRGTLTGSPIMATSSGTTKSFAFSTPGYYAYFCSVHGPSDGAAGMVGVVWVNDRPLTKMNGAAMTSLSRLTLLGTLLAATLTIGCSGSSNTNTPGTGGGGGGGSTGSGGSGPDPSFMAVVPCSTEDAYTTTGTTITFPATATDFNDSPKCLKVTAGASVTFSVSSWPIPCCRRRCGAPRREIRS